MAQASRYRWLLTLLRYGLCAGAIVYLYFNVKWHDHVQLADGASVRLVERRAGELLILRDGTQTSIPLSEIQRLPNGEPVIAYGIATVARGVDGRLAILAILIFFPTPLFQSLRLVWLLRAQDVRLRVWDAIKLTFAGNFFNFALPGTTGGDVIKAAYLVAYTHRKTEAVTTLVVDRVIGLIGLLVLATTTFLFAGRSQPWDAGVFPVVASGLAVLWGGLAVAALVVGVGPLRSALRLRQMAERMPAADHFLRIGRTIVELGRQRGVILRSVALTIALQMLAVVSAWIMALALRMEGGFGLYFLCIPIGFLLAAAPIVPPQGFGVVEWAYIQFLTPGDLNSPASAFALALAVRLIQFIWALPGMLVPLLGAHRPGKDAAAPASVVNHETG